ncbi:MAG TPA: alpha/beta hydrolase [Jatrophihabitantaceae bacterium]|jgi:pimeloyl-ACP methyl ester carboxylesterase
MTSTSTVTLPAGTIRYRDTGDGPPIVFVHGLLVDGRLWDQTLPHLDNRRLIVPDWPLGSHRSAMTNGTDLTPPGLARIVADTIAALNLEDVTLVGNDTGGAISQLVVTRHPQRISRLVLTNCDSHENFLPMMFRPLQAAARVPGAVRALAAAMRATWVRNLPMAYGRLAAQHIDPKLTADWVTPAREDQGVRRDVTAVLRGISNRYTIEAAAQLKKFSGKTLLAWGRDDRFFKPRHAERLAAEFADARLEWIDDARTFVSLDQPERLAELITEFTS